MNRVLVSKTESKRKQLHNLQSCVLLTMASDKPPVNPMNAAPQAAIFFTGCAPACIQKKKEKKKQERGRKQESKARWSSKRTQHNMSKRGSGKRVRGERSKEGNRRAKNKSKNKAQQELEQRCSNKGTY